MSILEDAKLQCSQVWDIYAVVQPKEPIRTGGPLGLGFVGYVGVPAPLGLTEG